MRSRAGDVALLIYVTALLMVASVITASLLTGDCGRLGYRNGETSESSHNNCETELRSLGYQKAPQNRSDSSRSDQQARDKLCQKVMASETARNIAECTVAQVRLSAFNLVLVFLAALAAGVAAWFTRRQANIAEEAYRRLERPYLFIKIVGSDFSKPITVDDDDPKINVTLFNHGKTPAVLSWFSIGLSYNQEFPPKST